MQINACELNLTHVSSTYELNLKTDGTPMQINAYGVVDKLTSIALAFPNPEKKDLQSEVMEYYLSYFHPDILIGSNYFWEFLLPPMENLHPDSGK